MTVNLKDTQQTTVDHTPQIQDINWLYAPIIDACCVQASYEHLLILTKNGELYGINLDSNIISLLCVTTLPVLAPDTDNRYFGNTRYKLHASTNGNYAAIVADFGHHGIVLETQTGKVIMQLDGGNYCEETVPFSACFLNIQGEDVFVHRTAWNRLDAANPANGISLTERYIAPYESGKENLHYLDYFHGKLTPSPDGQYLLDDGWVWQPVSVPMVWSTYAWLKENPWESEDGKTLQRLTMRDDWTIPSCWINNQQIALWGLADWDIEEFEEVGQGSGVRIFDIHNLDKVTSSTLPMDIDENQKVLGLFSDSQYLYVSTNVQTTIWDVTTHTKILTVDAFSAQLHHPTRRSLIQFSADKIKEIYLFDFLEHLQ